MRKFQRIRTNEIDISDDMIKEDLEEQDLTEVWKGWSEAQREAHIQDFAEFQLSEEICCDTEYFEIT